MICHNCKKEYNGKFCPYCGEETKEKPDYWEPNTWQRILIYIGAALAAVACWFGLRGFLM